VKISLAWEWEFGDGVLLGALCGFFPRAGKNKGKGSGCPLSIPGRRDRTVFNDCYECSCLLGILSDSFVWH
jgi:hypothetical protein